MAATHPIAGIELVKYAEAIGLDEYLFGDHVVLGGDMSSYPYGRFGYGDAESGQAGLIQPDEPCFPDPLALLAAAAVSTKRIRLGSGILLAALRQPVVLAKMLGTIDQLSDGRLTIGVGTGWLRKEFDACGVPFERRWTALSDTIKACRVLWSQSPAKFVSETISFDDVYCHPAPTRRVPVWLGTRMSEKRANWVAEFGDGWFPLTGSSADIGEGVELLHAAYAKRGRPVTDLGIRIYGPEVRDLRGRLEVNATLEAAQPWLRAGANSFWYVAFPQTGLSSLDDVKHWMDQIAALRAAFAGSVT